MYPFLTFREDVNNKSEYFILQKNFPHYKGKIVSSQQQNSIINAPISGYNLWISFAGTLQGNYIPSYKGAKDEIIDVFFNMAEWYFLNRIKTDEKRYKKFKIGYVDNSNK